MRIKKCWKIAGISILASAAVVTPLAVLLYPVDLNNPMANYLFKATDDLDGTKNAYIDKIKDDASKVINDYKAEPGKQNSSLNFWSLNLKSTQSAGELNYFDVLNRTMRHIDPSLGIKNILRTPQTTQEGYYNRNTEIMSFYWSPDYNGVGTWTSVLFSDSFNLANMWPPTYVALKNWKSTGISVYGWEESLYKEFENARIPGIAIADNKLYRSQEDIFAWVGGPNNVTDKGDGTYSHKIGIEDYFTFIANTIGKWISANSEANISEVAETDPITEKTVFHKKYAGIGNVIGLGIKYVDWIASKNVNIPFEEDGPHTQTPSLVRKGLYKQENPNTDTDYRDWYIRSAETDRDVIKIWNEQNPFENSKTPWNPAFTQAPNTKFAGSVWTGLNSWTTVGDQNDPNLEYKDANYLVSNGIKNDLTDPGQYSELETQFDNKTGGVSTVDFKIRPIPWTNKDGAPVSNGGKQMFLSPQDFLAGFKAFQRSISSTINSNNAYFVGLSGIDFAATFADPNNQLRNDASTDEKEFKVYFKDSILNFKDTLDVLSKQYFFALPNWHPKVQNIIDDTKWAAATGGNFNPSTQDFNLFYGCGDGKNRNVWEDLYYAAPYTISDVTEQTIVYSLNEAYFNAFNDVKSKDEYINFNISIIDSSKKGSGTKRIKTIQRRYAGGYNESILYESFKANEVDFSPIMSSSLTDAFANFKDQIKNYGISKLSQSNTFAYNLQVYEKFTVTSPGKDGGMQNIIVDTNGNPMWDPINHKPTYTTDAHGNYVFPAGSTPKLKSRVSQSYYDLIVKDFYTPGGKSQTIRHAINNSINWVALKSLVTPGANKSIQYSFMPYGVYSINNNDPDSTIKTGEYWDYAANKRYDGFDPKSLDKRQTGNMIWSYDEMVKGMIK